ncbi:hypothetical protein BIFDEN_01102 [Bifidobacterium dentium ATCC 27678]|nr:hypothetical protein BIFDEN_01102 [Bifidobacterium dentium ATCC 27678]
MQKRSFMEWDWIHVLGHTTIIRVLVMVDIVSRKIQSNYLRIMTKFRRISSVPLWMPIVLEKILLLRK